MNAQSGGYGIRQDRRGHAERYRAPDLAREGLGAGNIDGKGGIEPMRFGEIRSAPVELEFTRFGGRLAARNPSGFQLQGSDSGAAKRRCHGDGEGADRKAP